MIKKLGIYGFPSFYGGADTELMDQLLVWRKMGIELHVVPSSSQVPGVVTDYVKSLATVHQPNRFMHFQGMPVISFCCGAFLNNLEKIRHHASFVMWANCMTYIFPAEERAHEKNHIDLHLYQTEHAKRLVGERLKATNPRLESALFKPYFNKSRFPFYASRDTSKFVFGRISRDDPSKYMPETLDVYDMVSSPLPKEALILGFTEAKQRKIGCPKSSWIKTFRPMSISQQEFYRRCGTLLQTSTCRENWPRVGLEAMASGSVLIVYSNEGWKSQVVHGETGYLCDSPKDFVFYASHLAHHPELRSKMATAALERLECLAGLEVSMESWNSVFNRI